MKQQESDYRFLNGEEMIFLALFVFGVFVYECYQGYAWASENAVLEKAACEQEFSTQQSLRWSRYFTKFGCTYYVERTAKNINTEESYQVDE